MGATDLKGAMTMDSSQWESALGRADARASAFADKVEHKLSKKVSKLFGASALAGFLISPLHKMLDALGGADERAGKIKEESEKLHVTAEEYQLIQEAAKNAGLSVEEWIKQVKQSNTPLSKVISELDAFKEAITFTNDAVENLTDNSFFQWLSKIGDMLGRVKSNAIDGVANAFTRLAVLINDPQLFSHPLEARKRAFEAVEGYDAMEKKDAAGPSVGLKKLFGGDQPFHNIQGANALQKIGAFVGGGDPMQQALDKIASHAEKTEAATISSAESLKALAQSAGKFGGAGAGGDW